MNMETEYALFMAISNLIDEIKEIELRTIWELGSSRQLKHAAKMLLEKAFYLKVNMLHIRRKWARSEPLFLVIIRHWSLDV